MLQKSEKIPKSIVALRSIYLIATVIVGTIGIYLNANVRGLNVFSYYTTQSNVICILACLFFLVQLFAPQKISITVLIALQGSIVMCIMLTFLVFHFLLLPTIDPNSDILRYGNIHVHYVLPLMVLGDYLFFQKKGFLQYKWIGYWTLIPLLYCAFVFVYSAFGGRFGSDKELFPYFFLDYTRFGVGGVILWVFALALCYILLSALLVALDRILKKIQGRIQK